MKLENREVVEKLERVWADLEALCRSLSNDEWQRATDCPGWSVKDQLSHIVGTEAFLDGRPLPSHTPNDTRHVKNAIGETNEVQVDYRRQWPPEKVLEEFEALTSKRISDLRAMSDEEFEAESWTPNGRGTYREFMEIRIFDSWVHEQDIRRAVGKPGGLSGPVAEHSFNRCVKAMPYVVGKRAAAPEGSTVVFDIEGDAARAVAVGVVDGRGRELEEVPPSPTTSLRMSFETFAALCNGRWDPNEALDNGRVTIEGDHDLGKRVAENLAFMI